MKQPTSYLVEIDFITLKININHDAYRGFASAKQVLLPFGFESVENAEINIKVVKLVEHTLIS